MGENVTPAFLMEQVSGRTEAQAAHVIAVYLGKWMQLTGAVFNVARMATNTEGRMVGFNVGIPEKGLPRAISMFFQSGADKLDILHVGDIITVNGRLETVDSFGLMLIDCELVSVHPPTETAD